MFALTGAGVAWAEPAKITQAKAQADALQAKLQDLGAKVDAAVEDYDYAKAQLKKTNAAAQKTQAADVFTNENDALQAIASPEGLVSYQGL